MTYLAYLDLAVNRRRPAPHLELLASEAGFPVRSYDGAISIESIDRFLSESQGLLLFTDPFLLDPTIESSIHAALGNGKRRCAHRPKQLRDLELLSRAVCNRGHANRGFSSRARIGPSPNHSAAAIEEPAIICLTRPTGRRARLALNGPNVLRLDDRALPVLTLPLEIVELVDLRSDYFADWPTSSVAVVALSDDHVRTMGGVLAVTPGFWLDAYIGPTGIRFPGVAHGDNAILTRNIVQWLVQPDCLRSLTNSKRIA